MVSSIISATSQTQFSSIPTLLSSERSITMMVVMGSNQGPTDFELVNLQNLKLLIKLCKPVKKYRLNELFRFVFVKKKKESVVNF